MRRRKVEGKEGLGSSETGAKTDIAMTISVAEEATTSSAGDNKACSNGRVERTNVVVDRDREWGYPQERTPTL